MNFDKSKIKSVIKDIDIEKKLSEPEPEIQTHSRFVTYKLYFVWFFKWIFKLFYHPKPKQSIKSEKYNAIPVFDNEPVKHITTGNGAAWHNNRKQTRGRILQEIVLSDKTTVYIHHSRN